MRYQLDELVPQTNREKTHELRTPRRAERARHLLQPLQDGDRECRGRSAASDSVAVDVAEKSVDLVSTRPQTTIEAVKATIADEGYPVAGDTPSADGMTRRGRRRPPGAAGDPPRAVVPYATVLAWAVSLVGRAGDS